MTTRSLCLGQHTTVGTREVHVLYTVPAGFRTILKHWSVYNQGQVAARVLIQGTKADPAGDGIFLYEELAPATVQDRETWNVLHPGDFLIVYADVANVFFWLSGTELLLP